METVQQGNLISIIIPIYNTEQYLSECIESILCQTYENLEIILIDDGSTDSSGKIADEYACKDSRIKVIHKKNEGVSEARNCGINCSSGEWIAFVDSDDTVPEYYFEYLVTLAIDNDAEIAMGISNSMDEYGNIAYSKSIECSVKVFNRQDAISHLIEADLFGCGINKLYRKHLFDEVRFNQQYRINEDYLVNYACFSKAERILYSNCRMYNYRVRKESESRRRFDERMLDGVAINKTVMDDAKRHGKKIYLLALSRYAGVLLSCYKGSVKYLPKPIHKELYKKMGKLLFPAMMCKYLSLREKLQLLAAVLVPSLFKVIILRI